MDADMSSEPGSATEETAVAANDNLLDPATTERKLYRADGISREIWRPGDGDGDQTTDFFDRLGPPLPLEKRWRLFQTYIGKISNRNPPPRFVRLDDRSAYEVLKSDIPRNQLTIRWPHDFSANAKIRTRRPHSGRASIKDESAQGDAKYHCVVIGSTKPPQTYYFKGEKDYQAINYQYQPLDVLVEEPPKRKRSDPSELDNPRAHGHNQFTPKDMLVKHGAKSFSKKEIPAWKKDLEALSASTKLHRPSAVDREYHKREVEASRTQRFEAEEIERLHKALVAAHEERDTWKLEAESAKADAQNMVEEVAGLEGKVQELEKELAACKQQLANLQQSQ